SRRLCAFDPAAEEAQVAGGVDDVLDERCEHAGQAPQAAGEALDEEHDGVNGAADVLVHSVGEVVDLGMCRRHRLRSDRTPAKSNLAPGFSNSPPIEHRPAVAYAGLISNL